MPYYIRFSPTGRGQSLLLQAPFDSKEAAPVSGAGSLDFFRKWKSCEGVQVLTPLRRTDAGQALSEQAGDILDFVAAEAASGGLASASQLQAGGPVDRTGDDLTPYPVARREIVQCEKDRAITCPTRL